MRALRDRPDGRERNPELGEVAGPVALVAANLFVVFFGMSWGPVVWVLLGEMFPNRIRAIAKLEGWNSKRCRPCGADAGLARVQPYG
jgi:Sugar (and other) transporter